MVQQTEAERASGIPLEALIQVVRTMQNEIDTPFNVDKKPKTDRGVWSEKDTIEDVEQSLKKLAIACATTSQSLNNV